MGVRHYKGEGFGVRHYFCIMEIEFTLSQIEQTAIAFWQIAGENKVIALHGEMGSGKTTFIHALCHVKNVKDTVTSPTFSIINEYKYEPADNRNANETGIIYHMDLYRISSEEEARRAGVQDCLYSGHICIVEWPEKIPHLFPPQTMHIQLETINEITRRLILVRLPH